MNNYQLIGKFQSKRDTSAVYEVKRDKTTIPTCAEAQKMDSGRNKEKAEKWFDKHIKIIEL